MSYQSEPALWLTKPVFQYSAKGLDKTHVLVYCFHTGTCYYETEGMGTDTSPAYDIADGREVARCGAASCEAGGARIGGGNAFADR